MTKPSRFQLKEKKQAFAYREAGTPKEAARVALHDRKAPPEIPAFSDFMFWHPQLIDESLSSWFRGVGLDS
jgi:hypothetical protein